MKPNLLLLAGLALLASACTPTATSLPPTQPPMDTPSAAVLPTLTPTTLAPTPLPIVEDYGPSNFPPQVNPLTGLVVANPALLERRPLLIKVSNLPRSIRPQWGLSLADIVYEYYTEEGTTRFAAIFYGNDAEIVGPIRSARFLDVHLIRAYDAVFAFGLAYQKVLDRLYGAEFADRLVVESNQTPLYRYDPAGFNNLVTSTAALSDYITQSGVENGRQNLDGMTFQLAPPAGGTPAEYFTIRYSNAIYNRWDYDASLGCYLRSSDIADDPNSGLSEQVTPSTDRLTGLALAFDNVVVITVLHEHYADEVWDIQLIGSGPATVFRDGQVYLAQWQRPSPDSMLSLTDLNGAPFPFKPGTTWFEVIGQRSSTEGFGTAMRFQHYMP